VSLRPNKAAVMAALFFIFSLNLLKSSVFAINKMGLFFPILRVEQAHFSPLTTCLTTSGDFGVVLWDIFQLLLPRARQLFLSYQRRDVSQKVLHQQLP